MRTFPSDASQPQVGILNYWATIFAKFLAIRLNKSKDT